MMDTPILTVGNGPRKVLVLHGWFGSSLSWEPLRGALDRKAFTYVFADCRGYGARKDVRGAFTLEEVAQDALAAADALGWTRFSLVGHSMGGAAIQHVLAARPERVEALVGICPVPACGMPLDAAAMGFFESAATSFEVRRTILDRSTGNRLSCCWLDTMVANSFDRSTSEAVASYLHAWAKTDISSRIEGMEVPVHVIVGQHDAAINEALARRTWLRFYPRASLEVMLNAGHYPMHETPVALATCIERLLRSSSGTAPHPR